MSRNPRVDVRALKAALLAISAERIGSEEECQTAALTCGRMARSNGRTLDEVHEALVPDGIYDASLTWNYIVDGWYGVA